MFQRYLTISEFCVTGSGSTPSRDSPELYQGGNIPWIKSGELRENNILKAEEHVTKLAFEKTRLKLVPKGAILVAMYGATVGRMALLGIDAATNQAICHIIPDNKIADTKYLYHCLYHKVPELLTKAVGGAQPNINQQIIKNLRIPLPPLAEQKRIARILDVAAALQAQRRATLTHLDTLLQSTFLHMFGDPVTNPMHWETKKLSDCIVGSANNGFFAKNDKYEDEGTPVIWIGDFLDQFYSQTIGLKRVKATAKDIAKNRVEYGDVLFCRSSLTPAGIGKASIIPQNLKEETIFECHIIRCTLNQAMLIPEYFRVYSDTRYFRSQIVKNSKTATMTTISQQGVTETIVLVPPLELQKRFTKMARRILERQTILEQNAAKLGDLFASLQQRAFRGELSPSP